jgi:hypothetical protein
LAQILSSLSTSTPELQGIDRRKAYVFKTGACLTLYRCMLGLLHTFLLKPDKIPRAGRKDAISHYRATPEIA